MKVIAIGGYPGSGKSTLVNGAISTLYKDGWRFALLKYGKLMPYLESNRGLIILGTYTAGEQFPGTDRYPMNVQREAEQFFIDMGNEHPDTTVLFEGDRLFNASMLGFIKVFKGFTPITLIPCYMEVKPKLLEERRNSRSEQDAAWRKGRHTKVDRLRLQFPAKHVFKNNTDADMEKSIAELVMEIRGEWSGKQVDKRLKDYWR